MTVTSLSCVKNISDHVQSSSNLHTSKHVFRKQHRQGGRVSVSTRQQMLMQSLTEFFTKLENIQKFKELVKKGAPISLRVIDWFVTNYSKDNEVVYRKGADWIQSTSQIGGGSSKNKGGGCTDALKQNRMVNVHESYKAQLKAYSKRQFDPFCRRDRIHFYYTPTDKLETTVGQLNFFRWAIENNVIEYVQTHLKDIESAMRVYVRAQREARRKLAKKGKHVSGLMNTESNSTNGMVGGGKTRRRTSSGSAYTNSMSTNPSISLKSPMSNTSSVMRRNIFTTRANTTVYFS